MEDPELITKETYNRIAQEWVKEHNTPEYWEIEFGIFSKLLPQGKVLDVGCGGARDYQFFRKGNYEYTGVDYSEGLLREAKKQFPEAKFVEGNMLDLPFEQNEFNGFWAVASLLHIPKEKVGKALENIKRVVKEGGIGIIVLKKGEGEEIVADDNKTDSEADKRFFAFWQKEEFEKVLKDAGFQMCTFWSVREANVQRGLYCM